MVSFFRASSPSQLKSQYFQFTTLRFQTNELSIVCIIPCQNSPSNGVRHWPIPSPNTLPLRTSIRYHYVVLNFFEFFLVNVHTLHSCVKVGFIVVRNLNWLNTTSMDVGIHALNATRIQKTMKSHRFLLTRVRFNYDVGVDVMGNDINYLLGGLYLLFRQRNYQVHRTSRFGKVFGRSARPI